MNEQQFFEGVASYKLLTKKEIGQNFLIDASICKRIVDALDIQDGEHILEIGCGAGSLTYFLGQYPNEVTSIDIDEAMLAKVQNDFKDVSSLHIEYGNAAKYDYAPFDKIIGNLPYYITSLIVERVLLNGVKAKKIIFMVQKEAAERLLAKPRSKDYGPLAILLFLSFYAKRCFNVGRNSFVPPPHVESTVIEITRNEAIDIIEASKAYKLANALFLYRRKTIYNNLKNMLKDGEKASTILAENNIPSNARPEELTPMQYLMLSRTIEADL